MPATHRQADIEELWRREGAPPLPTKQAFAAFTRRVAAGLHFGIPAWGIVAEPGWGVRINTTGTTSADTLRFLDVQAVDIAPGSGAPEWAARDDDKKFHWLTFDPSEDGFGVGRAPARRQDLPDLGPVDPPPPPTGDSGIRNLILTPRQGDYQTWLDQSGWFLDAEVQRHFMASSAGALRGFATRDRGHFDWRMSPHEIRRWANEGPDGDLAKHGLTPPLTVGKLLDMTWPGGAEPDPLPVAPSFLEMDTPIGNFLHPARMYFPPSAWVKSEAELRAWLAWHQQNGYTVVLAMLEQTHWGTREGFDPRWTKPDPATPLVFTGEHHQVFGWTNNTAELHRRIEIARREYGLEVVLSLWEQERIEFDVESAIDQTPRIVAEFNDEVTAFRNSWELDEVLSLDEQHALNNAIGAAASKPSGPHFANSGHADEAYWEKSHASQILWHQYDTSHSLAELADDTRDVLARNTRVTVVCDEHSPAVRHGAYTHAESRSRGNTCRDAGAVGGMNG